MHCVYEILVQSLSRSLPATSERLGVEAISPKQFLCLAGFCSPQPSGCELILAMLPVAPPVWIRLQCNFSTHVGGAYPKAAPISRAASWPARDTLDGRLCRADRAAIELAAISLGLNHSFELVHVNEHTIETWQIHRLGLALTDGVVDVSG